MKKKETTIRTILARKYYEDYVRTPPIKKISRDSDAPNKKFCINTKEPEGAWRHRKAASRCEPDLVPLNHAGISWIKMMRDQDQNTLAVINHHDQTTADIINLCRQADNTYYTF